MRKAAWSSAIALVLGSVAAAVAVAQDQPEDIVVAGKIVARVRDPGEFSSTMERAQKINARIVEAISKKEVGEPKMALKQEGGAPAIYCGTTMLMRVYPGDAKANNLSPKSLARLWMKNFERELPNCEPMPDRIKRLGDAAFEKIPPEPAKPPVTSSGSAPAKAAEEKPRATAVKVAAGPAKLPPEKKPVPKKPPTPLKRGVAQLVVLDTFSMIRRLSDEDYEKKKDQWANNLIERLRPFIRSEIMGGGAVPVLAPQAATSAASTDRLPVLAPPPSKTPKKPATVVVPEKPVEVEKPAEEKPPGEAPRPPAEEKPVPVPVPEVKLPTKPPIIPGGAESKVPQKERIRRKMDAAKQPYLDLKAAGDPKAEQVGELLKAARQKLYAEQFDESEEMMDAALKLLGVTVQ